MRSLSSYRDPAPSRLSYRMQRLMLTPMVRRMLRTGLPTLSVVIGVAIFASSQDRRDAVRLWIDDVKSEIQQRPEFMVKLMAIDGASPDLSTDIRDVLPIDFPVSSFDLDLPAMHGTIAGLDAVRSVDLRVRPGGVLQVSVDEREPALVWRNRVELELLDAEGHRVSPITHRQIRADLPLVVGKGADAVVPEALALLNAVQPIGGRLRGLKRVGERRWDVVLDRGQKIMLPAAKPVSALEQVIALHQAQDLLDRDITAIDMRNPRRPTVRLAQQAAAELYRVKAIELGETTQ